MADPVSHLPIYDDEKNTSDSSSLSKKLHDDSDVVVDDAELTKEVEEMEDRIANDEATEAEYRVEEAYEVAVKVTHPALPRLRTYRPVLPRSYRREMTLSSKRSPSGRSSSAWASRPSERMCLRCVKRVQN